MSTDPLVRRAFLRRCALAGAGLLAAPAPRTFAAMPAPDWQGLTPDEVEDRIGALMKTHRVPGVSVALVRDGKVCWRKGYGRLKADDPAPVTESSIFQAASISKPVFAVGVMKLVEDGRLGLDTPLQEYLDEPYLENEPQVGRVTAAMVLEHSTGWPNWRRDKPLAFRFAPGTDFGYSGEGFVYLQTAVERIVGGPLDDWLTDHLLRPLGMNDSRYTWTREMEERAAAGHDADGVPSPPRKFSRPMTSHSLLTTAGDLAKSLAFMIDPPGGAADLPGPATVRRMLEPRRPDTRREHVRRGLGWALQTRPAAFYHTGSNTGGHRAFAMASTRTRAGVVVLTNSPGGRDLYRALVESVAGPQPIFAGD